MAVWLSFGTLMISSSTVIFGTSMVFPNLWSGTSSMVFSDGSRQLEELFDDPRNRNAPGQLYRDRLLARLGDDSRHFGLILGDLRHWNAIQQLI